MDVRRLRRWRGGFILWTAVDRERARYEIGWDDERHRAFLARLDGRHWVVAERGVVGYRGGKPIFATGAASGRRGEVASGWDAGGGGTETWHGGRGVWRPGRRRGAGAFGPGPGDGPAVGYGPFGWGRSGLRRVPGGEIFGIYVPNGSRPVPVGSKIVGHTTAKTDGSTTTYTTKTDEVATWSVGNFQWDTTRTLRTSITTARSDGSLRVVTYGRDGQKESETEITSSNEGRDTHSETKDLVDGSRTVVDIHYTNDSATRTTTSTDRDGKKTTETVTVKKNDEGSVTTTTTKTDADGRTTTTRQTTPPPSNDDDSMPSDDGGDERPETPLSYLPGQVPIVWDLLLQLAAGPHGESGEATEGVPLDAAVRDRVKDIVIDSHSGDSWEWGTTNGEGPQTRPYFDETLSGDDGGDGDDWGILHPNAFVAFEGGQDLSRGALVRLGHDLLRAP